MFEGMAFVNPYCPRQEARSALTEKDIQCGTKKGEMDEMRTQYVGEKSYTVVERCKSEWWKLYKTDVSVKENLR